MTASEEENRKRTCVIVDDAFNAPPASQFFDQLSVFRRNLVTDPQRAAFCSALGREPEDFDELLEELEDSDECVQSLYENYPEINDESVKTLVEEAFSEKANQRVDLLNLIRFLETRGYSCIAEGVESNKMGEADLFFVDLFLIPATHSYEDAWPVTLDKIRDLEARYTSERLRKFILMSSQHERLPMALADLLKEHDLYGGQCARLNKAHLVMGAAVIGAISSMEDAEQETKAVITAVDRLKSESQEAAKKFGELSNAWKPPITKISRTWFLIMKASE